jgi:hypothetical protein
VYTCSIPFWVTLLFFLVALGCFKQAGRFEYFACTALIRLIRTRQYLFLYLFLFDDRKTGSGSQIAHGHVPPYYPGGVQYNIIIDSRVVSVYLSVRGNNYLSYVFVCFYISPTPGLD